MQPKLNAPQYNVDACYPAGELSFHDDILVYGGDKLAKKTNGKEFREYRVIKMDNGIIIKYVPS